MKRRESGKQIVKKGGGGGENEKKGRETMASDCGASAHIPLLSHTRTHTKSGKQRMCRLHEREKPRCSLNRKAALLSLSLFLSLFHFPSLFGWLVFLHSACCATAPSPFFIFSNLDAPSILVRLCASSKSPCNEKKRKRKREREREELVSKLFRRVCLCVCLKVI